MVCLWVLVHSGSLIHVTVNAVHTVIFILLYFQLVLPSCISSLMLKSFHCPSEEGLHLGRQKYLNIHELFFSNYIGASESTEFGNMHYVALS
jgi:hypothetical protein